MDAVLGGAGGTGGASPAGDAASPRPPSRDAASAAAARDMVPALLELKARADAALSSAFGGAPDFVHAAQDAFEACVNGRGSAPAEAVAKYLDAELRAGRG